MGEVTIALLASGLAVAVAVTATWMAVQQQRAAPAPSSIRVLEERIKAQANTIEWLLARVAELQEKAQEQAWVIETYESDLKKLRQEAETMRRRMEGLGFKE